MKCTSGGTCLSRFSNAEDARGLSLFVARKMPGLIQMRFFSSPARIRRVSARAKRSVRNSTSRRNDSIALYLKDKSF